MHRLLQKMRCYSVLLMLVAGLAGCGEEPPKLFKAPSLEVEFAGCLAVDPGPTCVLRKNRRPSIWVRSIPGARTVVEIDGRPTQDEGVEVQLGRRFELQFEEASELVVSVEGSPQRWRLAFTKAQKLDLLEEARTLYRSGELESARRKLETAMESSPHIRARALGDLASIELQLGKTQEARRLLEEAMAAHRALGQSSLERGNASVLLYLLIYREQDFAAARQVLDSLPEEEGILAEQAYDKDYLAGLLAAQVGDLRTALRGMRAAVERAERLGFERRRRSAEQVLAWMLQHVGRGNEAKELIERIVTSLPPDLHPCLRGQVLNNIGWTTLLMLETGEPAENPSALLEDTLKTFLQECPQLLPEHINVRINLALAHFHGGRFEVARQHLLAARQLGTVPELRMEFWLLELEARLELQQGNGEGALRLYGQMAHLAALGFSPEIEWQAGLGKARSLQALGKPQEALEVFGEAETLLEEASLLVSLPEGRASFLTRHEEGLRHYLTQLLQLERPETALEVARRARSRILRGLVRQERLARLTPQEQGQWDQAISLYRSGRTALDTDAANDWQLAEDHLRQTEAERRAKHQELLQLLDRALAMGEESQDALPKVTAGDLVLLYHPTAAGWFGFAFDHLGLEVLPLICDPGSTEGEQLGHCLLTPFAHRIAAARRLRFLPYGPLRHVDLHALPFKNTVLLEARPVIYGLDLESPAKANPSSTQADSKRALLIADPLGNLPAARREAEFIANALQDHAAGWQIQRMDGVAATSTSLLDSLPGAALLHYAGHAVFSGVGGWESSLPLAAGGRLTVGDILTLDGVPDLVVLSGCETGRTAAVSTESVSLAHAFLTAGASQVVAATRPVNDIDAFQIFTAFYREWTAGSAVEEALRTAQLELRRTSPQADWAAFRLIEH